MTRRSGIPWEILPLGEHTDAAIAEELGVSRSSVRRARVRLGIPAFGEVGWANKLSREAPNTPTASRLSPALVDLLGPSAVEELEALMEAEAEKGRARRTHTRRAQVANLELRRDPREVERDGDLITLDEVVTGLGAPYVDNFPVPPGRRIRLITRERPGFVPEWVRVDYVLANEGVDVKGQLLLLFGEKQLAAKLGPTFWGGQQFPFPKCRDMLLMVGSLERVGIDLEQTGPDNLNSAEVVLRHDRTGWRGRPMPQRTAG